MPEVFAIRHGQSEFNRIWGETGVDPLIRDAPLSVEGHAQVAKARAAVLALQPTLVITSPLTRAIQTTLGLFGDAGVPIEVSPLHRERVTNSDDVGSAASDLRTAFPLLAFDHLDEVWWYDGPKDSLGVPVEPHDHFEGRINAFLEDLTARSEDRIVVVGHGTFFHRVLGGVHLGNCEIAPLPIARE